MADIKRTTEGLEHCLARYVDGLCDDCPYMGEIDRSYMVPMKCKEIIMREALELLKEQHGLMLALEQSNASNEYLNNSVSELAETINILKIEIERLKDDKANVIKLLEKEREENKPGSDYVIRPMKASDINEQHKGMYYAFSFAINALIEKGR